MSATLQTQTLDGKIQIVSADVEALYSDYAITLDDLNLGAWPQFFTDTCLYRITTRENWDCGYPLSTVMCESRGMLEDRVAAINSSMMYAPRTYRRFQSALKIMPVNERVVKARSNFLVVQTLVDKPSETAFCGIAFDMIVNESGKLKFQERVCVMDTEMIPNSLIYPL